MATRAELPDLVLLERDAELATLPRARGRGARRRGRASSRSRAPPGSARRGCWPRRAPAARRGMRVLTARARRARGRLRLRRRAAALRVAARDRRRPTQRAELLSGAAALAEPLFDATHLDHARRARGQRAVRDDARPLLARRQPRLRAADDARDRRPALGGHAVAALALLPRAAARGPAAARRRDHAAARAGPRPRAADRAARRPGDDADPARAAAGPSRSQR